VRCPTGESKTTIAGELRCTWVIHTVGPNHQWVDNDNEFDQLLFQAYCSAMQQARLKTMRTVAFSLLSAGIFRGRRPLRAVLALGMLAVEANLYAGLEEVVFVGFTRNEIETLQSLGEEFLGAPDADAARQLAVKEFCMPVRRMHQESLASRDPYIGFDIAMAAAVALPALIDTFAAVAVNDSTPATDAMDE